MAGKKYREALAKLDRTQEYDLAAT